MFLSIYYNLIFLILVGNLNERTGADKKRTNVSYE